LDLGPKVGYLPAFQGDLPRGESAKGDPRPIPPESIYGSSRFLMHAHVAQVAVKKYPLKNKTTIMDHPTPIGANQ